MVAAARTGPAMPRIFDELWDELGAGLVAATDDAVEAQAAVEDAMGTTS